MKVRFRKKRKKKKKSCLVYLKKLDCTSIWGNICHNVELVEKNTIWLLKFFDFVLSKFDYQNELNEMRSS